MRYKSAGIGIHGFGWYTGQISRFKLFQKSEQGCGFSDSTELNAKSLYFYKQLLDIDNLVADQGLEEDTQQSYQSVLDVLILDGFTSVNTIGDV